MISTTTPTSPWRLAFTAIAVTMLILIFWRYLA